MTDSEFTAQTSFGALVAFGTVYAVRSEVLTNLWHWYCVPLGTPELHFANAFGLLLVVWHLLPPKAKYPKEQIQPDDLPEHVARDIVGALAVLLLGWVVASV